MRFITLGLAFVLIVCSLSCVSQGQNQQAANSQSKQLVAVLRSVPALVNEETEPAVKALETKIKGRAGEPFEFRQAQFVGEKYGWAMSNRSLYRTEDGGETWEPLSQHPEKDATFEAFFFVNESRGWLASVKRVFIDRYGLGNSSVIMVTDDGGKSWKLQASFPNEVVISEIRFRNEDEGLAVGAQVIDSKPPYDELLVLKSSNGGQEWINISDRAKAAIKDENGLPSESGKHIEWVGSSALLLTRFGRIVSTTDGGETWKPIATFKRALPRGIVSSTGYMKIVLNGEQRIGIVAAGPTGDYVGDFVVQEDGQWTNHEMSLTPILDALFLSDKELVACGANLRPVNEKSKLKDAGVILRSFDSGKSWQSIYRSKSYETFFFITKVKENDFYAVSDKGTFLRFTLPR